MAKEIIGGDYCKPRKTPNHEFDFALWVLEQVELGDVGGDGGSKVFSKSFSDFDFRGKIR